VHEIRGIEYTLSTMCERVCAVFIHSWEESEWYTKCLCVVFIHSWGKRIVHEMPIYCVHS